MQVSLVLLTLTIVNHNLRLHVLGLLCIAICHLIVTLVKLARNMRILIILGEPTLLQRSLIQLTRQATLHHVQLVNLVFDGEVLVA